MVKYFKNKWLGLRHFPCFRDIEVQLYHVNTIDNQTGLHLIPLYRQSYLNNNAVTLDMFRTIMLETVNVSIHANHSLWTIRVNRKVNIP